MSALGWHVPGRALLRILVNNPVPIKSRLLASRGGRDYMRLMKRCAFTLGAVLLFLASPAFPHMERASEIVTCVNAKNEELPGDRRDLASAFLETLQQDNVYQYVEGFTLVRGLPFPGLAWGLILDGSSNDWVAYELKREDGSERFPLVYVPSEVVEALAACGVAWGGVWQDEFPVVKRPPPAPISKWQQLPENPLLGDVSNLLPPKSIAD